MNDKKQLLLAFFMPLFRATGSVLFKDFFFETVCTSKFNYQGKEICLEYHEESLVETGYALLTLGLFVLSFILPFFVMWREKQARENKVEPLIKF